MKFLTEEPSPSPFSSHLSSNICLRILFSNTLSLHSSLHVRDHVSQPYSTTGHIIGLYNFGLGVKCSLRDLRFAGSNPAEVEGFFSGRKHPEHMSSGSDFKLGVPSLRFQAR